MIDPSARVHGTADIEADVAVGPRTSIWHRAQVRTGARIGADCVIGRDAFIDEGVTLGDKVKVQNLALVYHGVTVEDGVFIGPNAILTNDRFPRAITSTGDLARADDWLVSPIALRYGCSIGAGAVVVAGTDVGRFATVGAGAIVTRNVPDHALVVGNPARRIGWVCDCGQRLTDSATGAPVPATPRGDTDLFCAACDRHFVYVPEAEAIRDAEPAANPPIHQGAKAIPISKPDIGPAEEEAVLEVLRSGMLAMGKKTEAFEQAWAAYCGVRHAIFMANGTLAQEAVLHALGIGAGDEVITVSFSFNATVSVILRTGARPVFVDIRAEDFAMDPDLVEAAITPRTKAIMPVHLYGLMADMDPLVAIAERHGLTIVEDAAQAHGAAYRGRRAGQFGPAMFSTYATKNLMTGEGGFATTDDDALADRIRLFRNHGMRVRYYHEELGTNYKPTDLVAAIGLAQLARLDERTARRRHNAAALTAGLGGYLTPTEPAGREHVWHQYTMRFPGERSAVVDGLAERGVGSLLYYPVPIHKQAYLQKIMPGAADLDLPVTNQLVDEIVSIPVRPSLTDDELATVVAAVRAVATPLADTARGGAVAS